MTTQNIRQFCNVCNCKIIEGGCPEPCRGDGRATYIVEHPQGYTYMLRADNPVQALEIVAIDRGWDRSIVGECEVWEG